MWNKLKRVWEPILGYSIVAIIFIGIVSIPALLGGGIMKLFGFRYDSIGSIIIFFMASAVIGFPLETFVGAFSKALLSVGKATLCQAKVIFVLLDTMASMIVLALVDYFMRSVYATELSIFVVALVMALLSVKELDHYSESE